MIDDQPPSGREVLTLLSHAAADDWDTAAGMLARIAERGGMRALYATTAGMATAAVSLLDMTPEPGGFVGLELGEGLDPAKVWAGRFLTANANNDHDTMLALFHAELAAAPDLDNPTGLFAGGGS